MILMKIALSTLQFLIVLFDLDFKRENFKCLIYNEIQNHFFLIVFFFSTYLLFTQLSKCFYKNTSANGFSQYLQGTIFIYSSFSSHYSSFYSSFTFYFFIALMAALKSSDAAFQLSLVF
jgi:hypothetical protein